MQIGKVCQTDHTQESDLCFSEKKYKTQNPRHQFNLDLIFFELFFTQNSKKAENFFLLNFVVVVILALYFLEEASPNA